MHFRATGREVTEDDERPWLTEWLNADPNGFALELWMERGSASVRSARPESFSPRLRVSA